ncbi:MAG: insulinase family protein [Candidatus Latescibacterota bacterium]|nr:MAG: insulinase family protein [Candidatus Latescibacterota bacterium]
MTRNRRLIPIVTGAAIVAAGAVGIALAGTSPGEELVLDNGLRVLLLPHPGSGLIASNVFVGAGSTREEARYAGSSHFLEHVLFNGTARRTQEELYAAADRIGAYNNATTRQEYTLYMMVAPSEKLAEALDIQADMLLHSTLPEDKFEKERGIVLEELSKDKDSPDYEQTRVLDELLYGADGDFARPILGNAESIAGLPRPSVVEYYESQYVPSNMRIVLMGEFESRAALDIVRKTFVASRSATSSPLPAPRSTLAAPGQMTIDGVEAPQVVVELTAALPAGSPNEDALLTLLVQIAGGTRSSRLARALETEPKLEHDDTSASLAYREGKRLFKLSIRLSAADQCRGATRRLLATLRSLSTIGDAEFEAARTVLLADEVSQIEKLHYYALFQGDRLWHMDEDYTSRYLEALTHANAASVGKMAERLLARAQVQVIAAGPSLETDRIALAELEPSMELVQSVLPQPQASGPRRVEPHSPLALDADQPPAVVRLANGMTLVHAATPSTRMFSLHLLVQNRGQREPAHFAGAADLLHRSIAKRIERPSEAGPSQLDRIGATLKIADNPWIPYDDYYTTPLYSFVRLECVDDYYRDALELLAQMLRGPHDDAQALAEAQQEMQMAMQRSGASPSSKARARLNEILYAGHPLSRPVLGSAESLASMTPEMLADFARDYLSPDQMILACVGNVPRDEAVERVEATLGRLQPASHQQPDASAFGGITPPLTESSARDEIEGGGNQAALRMARVVGVDPDDRWALLVATGIASSRMQQDLRETRGLAYSLGISMRDFGARATISASMATRPENLEEAEAGMLRYFTSGELEATPDEIETVVNKHLSRMRMRRITSMGQAFTLSRDLFLYDDLGYADREAPGLMAVTPEDVQRAARRYLSDGPMVTVIVR